MEVRGSSSKGHPRLRCAAVLEQVVYYGLLQALALSAAAALGAELGAQWAAAGYFGLYFAWHVHTYAAAHANCTLSPGLLSLSLASYVLLTAPALLLHCAPQMRMGSQFFGVLAAELACAAFGHAARAWLLQPP